MIIIHKVNGFGPAERAGEVGIGNWGQADTRLQLQGTADQQTC
jgi:hypothetical protein